jgi:hypothetical protein
MPAQSASPEVAAIEAAYATQLQLLFSRLVTNIGDEPTTHDTDQQCLDRFSKGLGIARRARQLALGVMGSAAPAATPSARRTTARAT